MHAPTRAGVAAIAVTCGALLGIVTPARAADPEVLYVNARSASCSDSGPGTAEQPFCTIGAAAAVVTAGQTVEVAAGTYPERVTVTRSGTAAQPITFRAAASGIPAIVGPTAGFVIDGLDHIKIQKIQITGSVDVPAIDVRDSSAVTIEGGTFVMANTATAPAIRLTGVTASLLDRPSVGGRLPAGGLFMDAGTTGVVVKGASVRSIAQARAVDGSTGIHVAGPSNTLVNNVVAGFGGTAIALEPGASGAVVANTRIEGGAGYGIHNRGAQGTAIANNTVKDRCLDGIRVDGPSTGVSVQNNVLSLNGHFGQTYCVGGPIDGVELGIYEAATNDTVVDYNNADHYFADSPTIYAWNGTRMSLADFRTASGQAAHDKETRLAKDHQDSANSAAPGYQITDRTGKGRVDDWAVPNSGAGPVQYADRGAEEAIRRPVAATRVGLDLAASSVTIDASTSQPGLSPITSYTFSFGDGTTVTQASPAVSHRYTQPGEYTVVTTVTDTNNLQGSRNDQVSVLQSTATVGLLSQYNLNYVAASPLGTAFQPDQTTVQPAGQFDLGNAGSDKVALLHRATGKYVSAGANRNDPLTMTGTTVGNAERFELTRNADGSISLRADSNGRFISILSQDSPFLVANALAAGTWERFHQVKVADAIRSLKALANSRYVCADNYGTKPLIASRLKVSGWEQFDVVQLWDGQVALFSHANRRFVTAQKAGAQPLLARGAAVGTWERFTMIRNSDGTVSFRATANNLYVSAPSAGALPLIASRTAIKTWEKFTLG